MLPAAVIGGSSAATLMMPALGDVSTRTLYMFALYPHAQAASRPVSQTERYVKDRLVEELFDLLYWVDFCLYSSNSDNTVINQSILEKLALRDEALRADHFDRLHIALQQRDEHAPPAVVFVCGKTCQTVFNMVAEKGNFFKREEVQSSSIYTISQCTCVESGIMFYALEGRNHPSYQSMTGRSSPAVAEFNETAKLLNALGLFAKEANANKARDLNLSALWDTCLRETDALLAAKLQQRQDGCKWLCDRLYGASDARATSGWFDDKHMHLRHARAFDLKVQRQIDAWLQEWGRDTVEAILTHGTLYRDVVKADEPLRRLLTVVGGNPEDLRLVLCNSVACALADERKCELFFEGVRELQTLLPLNVAVDDLRIVLCKGVVAALADPLRCGPCLAAAKTLASMCGPSALLRICKSRELSSRLPQVCEIMRLWAPPYESPAATNYVTALINNYKPDDLIANINMARDAYEKVRDAISTPGSDGLSEIPAGMRPFLTNLAAFQPPWKAYFIQCNFLNAVDALRKGQNAPPIACCFVDVIHRVHVHIEKARGN